MLRFSSVWSLLLSMLLPFCLVFLSHDVVHAATGTGGSGTCQSYNIPTALGPGQTTQYTIYGELCHPASGPSHTVQLLVPGSTYGHVYWDFPYQPPTYSYVHALNAAGYSTFNIDRIGDGRSSHPRSALVTIMSEAYVVHQMVQDLLHGKIGNHTFANVVLVGHSLGSFIAMEEAGTYHDDAGVIITGLTHHPNYVTFATLIGSFYSAYFDPRFSAEGLDAGYETTQPGTRINNFYYTPNTDPQVIKTDEATKETVTSEELADVDSASSNILNIAARITVPVLVAVGQYDATVCGSAATNCSSDATLYQGEARFYSPAAHLQTKIIPNAGHDINLHRNAPVWYAIAATWAKQHVAP